MLTQIWLSKSMKISVQEHVPSAKLKVNNGLKFIKRSGHQIPPACFTGQNTRQALRPTPRCSRLTAKLLVLTSLDQEPVRRIYRLSWVCRAREYQAFVFHSIPTSFWYLLKFRWYLFLPSCFVSVSSKHFVRTPNLQRNV